MKNETYIYFYLLSLNTACRKRDFFRDKVALRVTCHKRGTKTWQRTGRC